jgi:phage replication-related protein YjqB (UPF0714/DUF867 family)
VGRYRTYADLARSEILGRDYRIRMIDRRGSPVLIVAPHGGLIEDGTSELAEMIAGADHSLFLFEGLKPFGDNRVLHITSHEFDQPDCVALASNCDTVMSVHGCLGDERIHVGGRDGDLSAALAAHLSQAQFPVEADSRRYPGLHVRNICNRGRSGRGAQLEVTYDLRAEKWRAAIARAVRSAIAARSHHHMRRVSEAP